ncbi:MAG TPA: hypothetical protein VGD74_03255, partial [Vulgatibacter sp.]
TEPGCLDLELPGAIAAGRWSTQFGVSGITGQDGVTPIVYDLAKDPAGGVIATGYFSWSGTKALPPAAKLGAAGWEPLRTEWGRELPASGFAAAAVGETGAVALATFHAGSPDPWAPPQPRRTEIWVDDGEGFRTIGTALGVIHDLVWFDGALWVGGPFELESGESAGLAVWDGSGWSEPPGGAPDGSVYTVSRDGDSLLVGGQFDTIGGIASPRAAEFDGDGWIAHGMEWDATVYTLLRKDGVLFAGGLIIPDFDVPQGGIARELAGEWELLDGGVAAGWFAGTVGDLAIFQDDLYVAGCFKTVGGDDGIDAWSLARWTEAGWEAVGDPAAGAGSVWFNPMSCGDMGPYSRWDMQFQRFLVDGDRLLLAGSFSGVDDVASQSVIAFDGERWSPVGGGGQGFSGDPGALAVGGPECAVHALGRYASHAGGARIDGVVRWEEDGWRSIGGPMPARNECDRIVVDREGTIYVGCFQEPEDDGDLQPRVYAVGDGGWRPVGEPHPLKGLLFDMAIDRHDRIWIAGGAERGFVARLDGGAFEVLASNFDGPVFRIAVEPTEDGAATRAVASGFFEHLGTKSAAGIAHFDGKSWEALPGLGSTVMALAYAEHGIYASTTLEGDEARPILAHWDGGAWTDLGTPANGLPAPLEGTVHTFTSLLARGDLLIASGYVWPESGGRNVFVWDGSRFTSVGGGLAAISVDSIALAGDGLWFSGTIAEAGLSGQRIPTVGIARFGW